MKWQNAVKDTSPMNVVDDSAPVVPPTMMYYI